MEKEPHREGSEHQSDEAFESLVTPSYPSLLPSPDDQPLFARDFLLEKLGECIRKSRGEPRLQDRVVERLEKIISLYQSLYRLASPAAILTSGQAQCVSEVVEQLADQRSPKLRPATSGTPVELIQIATYMNTCGGTTPTMVRGQLEPDV